MDDTIRISNFEMKIKIKFTIALTVAIVLILVLSCTGRETLANVLIGITSSSFGVFGGYHVSKKIDRENRNDNAVRLKEEMLELISNEIYENSIIFDEDYDKEKTMGGFLNLKDKNKFKVDVWEKLKFKIFTEEMEILGEHEFKELSELYKRFERLNLQKELNVTVNEASKKSILNYIYSNLRINCPIQ